MTQFQEAPKQNDPFLQQEEEPEQTEQQTKQPKRSHKLRKAALAAGIAGLAVIYAALGHYIRTNTTLLMKHTVQEGYLPADDYQLIDDSTGKTAQHIRSTEYPCIYNTEFSENQYVTSRNIKIGSDWNSFVEAYGDYRTGIIQATPLVKVKNKDPYFLFDMTVSDFDEQYVKTGIVNPNEYSLSVTFTFYTDGYNVLYSWDDVEENRSDYAQQIHVLDRKSEMPREGYFLLGFSFNPIRENGEYVFRVRLLDSVFEPAH